MSDLQRTNTVATRAEDLDSTATSQSVECLGAQRRLAHAGLELMRRLPLRAENLRDLLRLGASCIQISAEQAFGARHERDAIGRWQECELGARQIRSATFQALRSGFIGTSHYDEIFRVAAQAARARGDEMLRLRRRLRRLAVV